VPERIIPVLDESRTSPAEPAPFDRIAIIGLGLIGGSIALAARRRWPSCLVIGVDRKDVLEKAMILRAVDVGADDLVVAREADLVVLAAPVEQNVRCLSAIDADVTGTAVITDTGSTKRRIVEAAVRLPARLTFVGGHPLGGAARGGIEFARADLFAGRPWLFTPTGTTPPATLERLETFVRALGATPSTLGAEAHDHLLAYLSHLPQLAVSALMKVVGEEAGEEGLALSGRGLRDTTRLASSPAGIWQDVCRTNADEIGPALDRLVATLTEIREDLSRGDAIETVFSAAAAWKRRLPTPDDR
jgi:prephenate dehydrogenase